MQNNTNVGIDIVEIKRFKEHPIEKYVTFYNTIFTDSEKKYCLKFAEPYSHFAGIFAAKEAIIKCLSKPIRFSSIEIKWDQNKKPFVKLKNSSVKYNISISHTLTIATAIALSSAK